MPQIRFPTRGGFHKTVKQRVEQYFADSGRSTTGDWRLFVKTGVILAWLVGSYVLLVFASPSLPVSMLAVFALAQGCALVGFNIMHDGAHGSYAHSTTINRLMGGMLNMIGGSQMLWRHKHNRLHHIYTNIHTLDNDLQTNGLLRFSPGQPWRPWHRFQHCYAFAVYSLLTLSWVTIGDWRKLLSGRIGHSALPQLTGADIGVFCCTKMGYFGYALLLPLYFHPWQHVLLAFVGVHLLLTMVAETCHAFGLPYVSYPTVRSAIAAHYRFLKTLGRRPRPSSPSSPLAIPPPPAISTTSPARP